jgi:hypothetical protein
MLHEGNVLSEGAQGHRQFTDTANVHKVLKLAQQILEGEEGKGRHLPLSSFSLKKKRQCTRNWY